MRARAEATWGVDAEASSNANAACVCERERVREREGWVHFRVEGLLEDRDVPKFGVWD